MTDCLVQAQTKSLESRDLAVDGIGPRPQEPNDAPAALEPSRRAKAQEMADVLEREPEPLKAPDEPELRHRLFVVDPVPGRRARGLSQQPDAFVEANGVSRHPAALGELPDLDVMFHPGRSPHLRAWT